MGPLFVSLFICLFTWRGCDGPLCPNISQAMDPLFIYLFVCLPGEAVMARLVLT